MTDPTAAVAEESLCCPGCAVLRVDVPSMTARQAASLHADAVVAR